LKTRRIQGWSGKKGERGETEEADAVFIAYLENDCDFVVLEGALGNEETGGVLRET
jgi:hypothetical protein